MKKISFPLTTPPEAKNIPSDTPAESSLRATFLNLPEESCDDENFIQAVRQGCYTYWLTLADVIDIARVEYNNFKRFKSISGSLNSDFQTLNSLDYLIDKITNFQSHAKQIGSARMTFIINTGYAHWTIIILSYHENYEKNFKICYVNSVNCRLTERIQDFFHTQKVLFYDLSQYLYEWMDTYDVGLWALEIAADLNKMLDENYDLGHMIVEFSYLSHQRDMNYFKQKRKTLANKLSSDPHSITSLVKPSTSGLGKITDSCSSASLAVIDEPELKRMKIESKEDAIQFRLEAFVEAFIKHISKLLSIYHIIAKGDRLNVENLATELKTGATAALLGITIAQGIAGSIPSLIATARSISSHYYFAKKKARKVTKAFETIPAGELSSLLSIVAVDIFYSYESQFMSVTDEAGNKVAMEKLAEDAAVRSLNYIDSLDPTQLITRDQLSQGVFLGKSEKYFNLSIKHLCIFMTGTKILSENHKKISTAKLYQQVGIRIVNTDTHKISFYQLKNFPDSFTYGYRRLLNWEKQKNGDPKEFLLEDYQPLVLSSPENQADSDLQNYEYYLDESKLEENANSLLKKIKKIETIQPTVSVKKPIYFNLRKAVNNFSGRKEVLNNLHELLIADRHIAVVTQDFSRLSLDRSSSSSTHTAQISLSGLGGVGKTQVALRYAELYASYYDDNVIWINAETKSDIINSFLKLTGLLDISIKNRFGNDKPIDELLPEIYDYFTDKKSLFIFDNVENYREFDQFLPRKQIGNTPTLLITSRFSHWRNILPVLTLGVFTEQEAMEFVKNELAIRTDDHDSKIKELIILVYRLPLALQQAVAYIAMQKYVNSQFSIDDYVEIFKTQAEKILCFDFKEYSNDPYLKSVFIIWNVTLNKIKNNKESGEKALEILNRMAYLYPDHITNNIFSCLETSEELSSAIRLLQSYSMISMGNQPDISVIHRLVQKVIRINLEKDFSALKKNAEKIFTITQNFHKDLELSVHYIYFLLYMSQDSNLSHRLKLGITKNRVMDIFIFSGDKIILAHLYESARLILTKQQYFNFIGDALFLYIKHGLLFFLSETISYLEKNLEAGVLLKSDIRIILDYRYKAAEEDPANWLVQDSDGRERQIHGVRFVSDFEKKFLFKKASSCSFKKRKRREVSCISEAFNLETNKNLFVESYLKFVAYCTDFVSSAQTSSQIISPNFLQKEWDQVALHFSKLLDTSLLEEASHISWLSEELSTLTKKGLLEKNSLNKTQAFHIFKNKQAILNKKKSFLTHVMKITKPFIKRSPSSIGNSYNFAKELKDYNALKKLKALQENNVNSSFNVFAGIAMSQTDRRQSDPEVEVFFNLIEDTIGLSEGITEIITIGTWLASNINQTIRQVSQIGRYVHLDEQETLMEDLRAFMHFTPSSYLETKAINNRLVQKALAFLKKHPSIQRYIFPAASSASQLAKDNQVFLQKKQSIKLNPSMPDKPDEGALFCLPGRLGSESYVKASEWVYIVPYPPNMRPRNLVTTYLCDAALGIEFSRNRSGNIILIDLDEGKDSAIGMPDLPNIFQVKSGNKNYKGGDIENLFLIQSGNITGILEGGKGLNRIKLGNFISHNAYSVLVDNKARLCTKNIDALTHQCGEKELQLKYIQHIYGRENKKDIIFINKDIQYIDGLAGKNNDEKDHIYLTQHSPENFLLMLRPYTVIHAFGLNQVLNPIRIDYRLLRQSGSILVQIGCNEPIHHRFNIEFSLNELFVFFVTKNQIVLKFSYGHHFFNLTIVTPLKKNCNDLSSQFSTIQFFLKDQEIRLINEKYLFIRDLSDRAIDELITDYLPLSLRLQIVIQLYSVEKKLMLQISHNQYAILYNEPSVKNYLISQSDKTVYLIKPSKKIDFPISEIVIYSVGKKKFSNTLDLREVWQQAKKTCVGHTIFPEIAEENQDLILRLKINYYRLLEDCVSLERFRPIITIKLRHALVDNAYQNLEILLYNIPYVIARNEPKNWYLKASPLVFSHKKNLILITKDDLLPETDIVVLKKGGNGEYSFFCHKGRDLLLTNSFDPRTQVDELYTVVYSQFYQDSKMRTLALTSSVTLIDQQIILKEQEKTIDNMSCFDVSQINLTVTFNNFFNKPLSQSSDSLNIHRRRKRQTKIKNSTVKNWNKVVFGDFFQTLPKIQPPPLANSSALLPSFRDHFPHSGSDFLASAANDTELHSQSLFLSWIYHTLWGKKAKPLNFRETIEIEHENQIYRAIDKFEKFQNKSSYSWS